MAARKATPPRDGAIVDPRDFIAAATEFGGASAERADEIFKLAVAAGRPPWECGLESGDFDLIQVDMIKLMLDKDSSVRGYQIVRPLGRGGMGVVYQARQLSLNRDVALKTILLSQLSSPTAVKRFENEGKILASLTHPNIVTAYDFGRHDGRLFLAMEFVRGKDVQRLIDHLGRVPENLVWHIIRQAAAGLAQANQAGVIHRDIKPANLLLVEPPDGFPLPAGVPLVKIADFGLSTLAADNDEHATDRLTSASMHVGSPLYMAPEQIESKEASAASDMFSLGATAWHMLVGEAPLSGEKLRSVITRRLTEPTEPVSAKVSDVSQATAELVAEMLQMDAEKRVPSYEQLLQRIDAVLQHLPTRYEPVAWMDIGEDSESELVAKHEGRGVATTSRIPIESNLSETQAFEPPSNPLVRKRWNPRAILAASVVSIALLIPLGLWFKSPEAEERLQGVYGPRITMFDGFTLSGWLPQRGSWVPTIDIEGARVLRGSDGMIAYDYSRLSTPRSNSLFAFEVAIDSSEAKTVEIEFDFARETQANPERQVIQIGTQSIIVGIRGMDGDLRAQQVFRWDGEPPLLLRIERQGDHWWLLRDGREIAQVEELHSATSDRLRLSVIDGTALFSDISYLPAKR